MVVILNKGEILLLEEKEQLSVRDYTTRNSESPTTIYRIGDCTEKETNAPHTSIHASGEVLVQRPEAGVSTRRTMGSQSKNLWSIRNV